MSHMSQTLRSLTIAFMTLVSFFLYSDYSPSSWYDDFYRSLQKQEIKSLRYFQIWVNPDEFVPIGGDREKTDLWQHAIEEFIDSSKNCNELWDGAFVYELVVDQKVFAGHQQLFASWQQRYGDKFRLRFIEESPPEAGTPMAIAYQQCLSGVAAVCSDYWRVVYGVDADVELNIYADIDTLSQGLTAKKQPSGQALGVNNLSPGLYFAYIDEPYQHWNNDFLIMYQPSQDSLNQVTALLAEQLERNQVSYDSLLNRQDLSNINSLQEYELFLKNRVDAFLNAPLSELNRFSLIINKIGPNFWERASQQGLVRPYRQSISDDVESYDSWNEHNFARHYESITVDFLKIFYDRREQKNLLSVLLLLNDRPFLRKKQVAWLADFENYFETVMGSQKEFMTTLPSHLNIIKKSLSDG